MPVTQSVQNNFIAGLKTEATGLNFPENAAVDSNNVIYSLIGDVFRRFGINYEANFSVPILENALAKSSYRWRNVGGDGQTEVIVVQRGATLYFFQSSAATITNPISTQLLASIVTLTPFQAMSNTNNIALTECQFTDGNGFLIIFHQDCNPIYCTFNAGVITPNAITVQIRDFVGIPEPNVPDNFRPPTLSPEHQYNLINQGWSSGTPWTAVIYNNGLNGYPGPTNEFAFPQGTFNLTNASQITIPVLTQTNTTSITNGSVIQLTFDNPFPQGAGNGNAGGVSIMNIFVTSYLTPFTSLTGNIQSCTINVGSGLDTSAQPFVFNYADYTGYLKLDNFVKHSDSDVVTASLTNVGFVQNWFTQVGNYPSNSDIWWLYKNTTNAFDPQHQLPNVQQPFGAATKGYFIMNAFIQNRSQLSNVQGLTTVQTTTRPTTGCWFQGRVFYSGVNASQQASGDEPYTTWTENIYFSRIVETPSDFGKCYQLNDPTSQTLFDILPADGGVITIPGCGAIYKLFPIENGLLVFAANGIWFITGSQGIGFSATDIAIRQVSKIQSISSHSFVNVNGFPMFWNEEGIYYVTPAQFGAGLNANATSFQVTNLALGSILTDYQNIPKQSKVFARGDYNPIDFVVAWVYRSTAESSLANRYNNDSAWCFNTVNKAFYPYTFPSTSAFITDIRYVSYPGASGTNVPPATFKYLVTNNNGGFTFAEERDTTFVDFFAADGVGTNFDSHFISGYNLSGKALLKFQPIYVYMYLRNTVNNSYKIQGSWDYAINRNSSKWSSVQLIQDNTNIANFSSIFRRHKIRGRGMALSFKVTSFAGKPFDIIGWSVLDNLMQTV